MPRRSNCVERLAPNRMPSSARPRRRAHARIELERIGPSAAGPASPCPSQTAERRGWCRPPRGGAPRRRRARRSSRMSRQAAVRRRRPSPAAGRSRRGGPTSCRPTGSPRGVNRQRDRRVAGEVERLRVLQHDAPHRQRRLPTDRRRSSSAPSVRRLDGQRRQDQRVAAAERARRRRGGVSGSARAPRDRSTRRDRAPAARYGPARPGSSRRRARRGTGRARRGLRQDDVARRPGRSARRRRSRSPEIVTPAARRRVQRLLERRPNGRCERMREVAR